ncbi:hypothetical protein [Dietzia psychralcaliphila]|uniref:Uncharacterized protein n=1 Tax=Dietzia psychralcaliphila TaxID=139021 RepID=A0AAD0JQF3_9ACTN|nr:hypothetical protein [Dietzia psychralcaliphila]AWH95184.1 hypothetical protein A6048_06455 [Dietzia psychralcaliphila]PTM87419.1 hypothetical protein C8N39_105251 [Dietzia psychralcaliphila]
MNPRTPLASGRARPTRAGRRLLVTALAAALVASTAACSDGGDSPGDDAVNSQEEQALEPAVEVDPGPAPTVELLDEGSGELRVLAYAPSREPVTVAVTRSATARTTVPGAEPRIDETPEQTLTVEGLSEPDVDGAQRATVTAREFTSVDELRSAQFATAPGFAVTWTRSADGIVRGLSLEAPATATDAARAGVEITANAVSDATVAWPTEAIGVGARWTVTRTVDDAVAPTRVVTYELTALDGDVATVDMEASAPDTAETLDAPAPDSGPGVTLEVEAYEVEGSGELTVDLRAPLPVDGTTESSTRAVYVDPESGRRTTYDEDSVLEFRRAD